MPRLATLILLAASLTLAACDRSGWRISQRLAKAVDSGTTPIDMTAVAPFEWDRMCVLGPYSMRQQARELLGFDWAVDDKSRIGGLDTISLLVFVQGQDVLAYAEHPRGQGDLLALSPRCLDRGAARLVNASRPGASAQLISTAQAAMKREVFKSDEPPQSVAPSASHAQPGKRP